VVAIAFLRLKGRSRQSERQQQDIQRLGAAVGQLTTANVGFQRYADLIEERSAVEERKRITRDVHDTIGYAMINIMMMMKEAAMLAGDGKPELARLIAQTRAQAQSGLDETRKALRLLRETEIPKARLIPVIRHLTRGFQSATGVKVDVEFANTPDSLGEEINQFVYQMIQEGMANAFRHGKASRILIRFWVGETHLIVTVRDNGIGCTDVVEGIGLSGMKERAERLAGELQAGSVYDGFQVAVRIPFKGAELRYGREDAVAAGGRPDPLRREPGEGPGDAGS
jgi:signal transduction histidine kinase